VIRLLAACALALGAGAVLARPAPSAIPVPATSPPPAIGAPAYLLIDYASGQGIVAENADERREPASLTKLMTAYLTFAALKQKQIQPAQNVPVSERAWKAEGSRMFIEPRKAVTVVARSARIHVVTPCY
jgi:D-alanyl-D-alanine carboxypeptidase